jgi:hypothetical protein
VSDDDVKMSQIARVLRAPVRLSASFDARVMNAIRRLPGHERIRLWARLTTPRSVMVTPLTWGILAASVACFAVLGALHAAVDIDRAAQPIASALFPANKKVVPPQRVQFVLVAPDAKKVAVVGFNGWDVARRLSGATSRRRRVVRDGRFPWATIATRS